MFSAIMHPVPFKPEETGYDSTRLTCLNDHILSLVNSKKLQAGSYMLSREGKTFASCSMGKLSYEEGDARPVNEDTIIRIASITKMFTAVSIMKLVEDGMMRLSQNVGDFIEEFKKPPYDDVTVFHLLTHTSGILPDQGAVYNAFSKSPWWFMEKAEANKENWIENALSAGKQAKTGKEWVYSSFGFIILGEIISRVSGIFANDYIIQNIVQPLGMKDTFFNITPDICDRILITHERSKRYIEEVKSGKYREDENDIWSRIPSTGGGLYSTLKDLDIFGNMLLGKGTYRDITVLSRKSYEKMVADYTNGVKDYCWNANGVAHPYGLGLEVRCGLNELYTKGTFMHEGAGASGLIIDPTEKMVATLFVPMMVDWFSEALYNTYAIMWSGII